ncbi:MAG: MarR family winged helix-turn-helix transcriptional regulator [Deinococcaceae bacterium]
MKDPSLDTTNARIEKALWKAAQAIKHTIAPQLQKHHGIEFKHFMVLDHIAKGLQYPRELSRCMSLLPSQMSRILEELSDLDCVGRSIDKGDSRRIQLTLTQKGLDILKAAQETTRSMINTALQGFEDPEEFAQLLEVFTEALEPASMGASDKEPS